jgi:hypothetical protein
VKGKGKAVDIEKSQDGAKKSGPKEGEPSKSGKQEGESSPATDNGN